MERSQNEIEYEKKFKTHKSFRNKNIHFLSREADC